MQPVLEFDLPPVLLLNQLFTIIFQPHLLLLCQNCAIFLISKNYPLFNFRLSPIMKKNSNLQAKKQKKKYFFSASSWLLKLTYWIFFPGMKLCCLSRFYLFNSTTSVSKLEVDKFSTAFGLLAKMWNNGVNVILNNHFKKNLMSLPVMCDSECQSSWCAQAGVTGCPKWKEF